MTTVQRSIFEETLDTVVADALKTVLQQPWNAEIMVGSSESNVDLYRRVTEVMRGKPNKTADMLIANGFAYLGRGLHTAGKGIVSHPTGSSDPEDVIHIDVGSTCVFDYESANYCFAEAAKKGMCSYLGEVLTYSQQSQYPQTFKTARQQAFTTAQDALQAPERTPLMWTLYAKAGYNHDPEKKGTSQRVINAERELGHISQEQRTNPQYILARVILDQLKTVLKSERRYDVRV